MIPSQSSCKIIVHAENQLILPAALKTIDSEAFTGLPIEEVILTDSLESIGENAFSNCDKLSLINIPDGVLIADNAFIGCERLNILCSEGSTSHTYAIEHDIPYVILTSNTSEAE